MPKLLLKFEAAAIREILLDKPSLTLGRKGDNDIVLDHAAVSGHHCKLYSAGSTWFVEDTGSTNGTFVNGKKVLKAGLKHNDVVTVVKYTLTYMEEGGASAPAEAPARAAAAPSPASATMSGQAGAKPRPFLEVLEGAVDKNEYEITALSTYIGKSAQANIPVKGSGLFGSAPDMAAVITVRPEGCYITPIKEGYAKHNGDPLNEKKQLKDDDVVEVGGTKLRFFFKKA
ncbi:MAG TPA: FHA domain-containing protein [Elusimicrobiales bacterium]|nr:FHA domain-containing protein [Elusimicrobiales bacterium]